jgi:hypothetical protein
VRLVFGFSSSSNLTWYYIGLTAGIVFLFAGYAAVSWPLNSYAKVAKVVLTGEVCGLTAVFGYLSYKHVGRLDLMDLAVYGAMMYAVWCGGVVGVGCLSVYLRKRYWPEYPPGHCDYCGYCLTGLSESRCPECGSVFLSVENFVEKVR